MDLRKLIQEYLEKARLMQVSTSKDNKPWTCSVYFAYDEDLNLYWISLPTTRHSQELRENEHVAGTIVLPHTPGEDVRGLQFEGVAKEITTTDKGFEHALLTYAKRMGMKEERQKEITNGTDGHAVYMIDPTSFVLFDTLNFPNNPRQKLSL